MVAGNLSQDHSGVICLFLKFSLKFASLELFFLVESHISKIQNGPVITFFSRQGIFKKLVFNKTWKNQIQNEIEKYSVDLAKVSNIIDFTAHRLPRDHSPA